jgi:hypothetical protein
MTPATFNSIPEAKWHEFSNGMQGFALAYYISQPSLDDIAEIDSLSIVADALGSWKSATKDVDFEYEYTSTTNLKVKILTAGDYKINY